MKQFISNHSYNMVKMFLNQFAIAVFGFVLVLAAGKADNVTLRNVTSVLSVLFYLFLLYTMTWEIGYRDKVSVETGRKKRNSFTGALISLCANIPNFVFAIFIALATFFNVPVLSNIGGVCSSLAIFLEGMYTGLLVNPVGGAPLNSYWFVYFLLPLPAILTCGIAYQMGIHDIKFTSLFNQPYPESDRDPQEKWKKK
jgi:hypothetical protein